MTLELNNDHIEIDIINSEEKSKPYRHISIHINNSEEQFNKSFELYQDFNIYNSEEPIQKFKKSAEPNQAHISSKEQIEEFNKSSKINHEISILAISPNAKYVVTFSKNGSIFGWNVNDDGHSKSSKSQDKGPFSNNGPSTSQDCKSDGKSYVPQDSGKSSVPQSGDKSSGPLNIDKIFTLHDSYPVNSSTKLEISDDKKIFIVFNNTDNKKKGNCKYLLYDMEKQIHLKLSPNISCLYTSKFISNGDLIFLGVDRIYKFSKPTKGSKYLCKKIIKVKRVNEKNAKKKGISGGYTDMPDMGIFDDKIYIRDDYYIYLIDAMTFKIIQSFPFGCECELKKITSNQRLTMILFNDNKCVAYPNGSNIPVSNNIKFDKKDTNRYIIYKADITNNTFTADIFDRYTSGFHENTKLVNSGKSFTIGKIMENKQVFGISGGKVWMIKLTEKDLETAITNESKKDVNFGGDKIPIEFEGNVYDNISTFSTLNCKNEGKLLLQFLFNEFNFTKTDPPQQFEWICENYNLCIYDSEGEKLTETGLRYCYKIVEYLNNDNVCLMNDESITIVHYNDDVNKIETLYIWNIKFINNALRILKREYLSLRDFKYEIKEIFQMEDNESYLGREWIDFIIGDNFLFSKYGEALLNLAIKKHKRIVKCIAEKCLQKYNDNPKWNVGYLGFICQHLKQFKKHYPEILSNFYSELALTLHPYDEEIKYLDYSHLHGFHDTFKLCNSMIIWEYLANSKFWKYLCNIKRKFLESIYYKIIYYTALIISNIIFFPFYASYVVWKGIYLVYLKYPSTPTLNFFVPLPKYVCYPKDYNWWYEIFKPQPSGFVQTINDEFYDTWNGEAIVNFKWNTYGKYYYTGIWVFFMAFLGCFTIISTVPPLNGGSREEKNLLIATVVLGGLHLLLEIRKIIWNPKKWILNTWNFFGLGSFAAPTGVALYWILTGIKCTPAIAISCLLLDIKFLLFFGVFESFGKYFTIVMGVAKTVISFLVMLLLIISSFAHSFYILLYPNLDSEKPLFSKIQTSLLAMYYGLIGDTDSLEKFSPNETSENPTLAVLFVIFTFIIVVYLMNLFIGLLNIAIVENTQRSKYLAHKAEILAEIELFYMFPHQRRNRLWFPEMIKYYVKVDKVRKVVNDLIKEEKWKPGRISPIQERLLKVLDIEFDEK